MDNRCQDYQLLLSATCLVASVSCLLSAEEPVEQYGIHEATFRAAGRDGNPYKDVAASVELRRPDGARRTIPLFWDGGSKWTLRVSPDLNGDWAYTIRSTDRGLDGRSGSFACTPSKRRGSIVPMDNFPHHFQYQNGAPMWFMGDTAWALLTDNDSEQHDQTAVEEYLRKRAAQGFNVVHTMALSEAGWGNSGGPPFDDLAAEKINPGYWQQVDRRVAYANQQGIVVGLALAWGDKRKQEPFAWRRFPSFAARKRYTRYVAARYSAYDVYFLVSGEWHGEIRTRASTEANVKREFVDIGNSLATADPHGRMIGIHPMTHLGSVREFHRAAWMSFGDYQQSYRDLHARILKSRPFNKPVVNSEYGYLLRDRDGDGTPDKDNSASPQSMRFASWDIVTAGGYVVTGFGTTYFGGHRSPGPFDLHATKNRVWEQQVAVMKSLFTILPWWRLTPHDHWLTCDTPRGNETKELGRTAPPRTTYWLLADPGRHYLAYARGLSVDLNIDLGLNAAGDYAARVGNPRNGVMQPMAGTTRRVVDRFVWKPPNSKDWVLLLRRVNAQ